MHSEFCAVDRAEGAVERVGLQPNSDLKAKGHFKIEHVRNGEVIGEYEVPNGIVDAGLNSILNIMFDSATQITAWYIGLIDNSGFSSLANGDTLASHSGWNEFSSYTGNRQAWTAGSASSRSITNSSTVNFSITGSGTLKGIFISDHATGTSGTLWSTAAFGSTVAVTSGDTLKVTYTVSG